jgi:gliding motility-associated-like protein
VNEVTVKKPIVPNIITPNNDQKNDNFFPQISCLPLTLRIFSRWGNMVYEQENYSREFNSDKLSAGTYYFVLRDTSGRKWKGWLEIVK